MDSHTDGLGQTQRDTNKAKRHKCGGQIAKGEHEWAEKEIERVRREQ